MLRHLIGLRAEFQEHTWDYRTWSARWIVDGTEARYVVKRNKTTVLGYLPAMSRWYSNGHTPAEGMRHVMPADCYERSSVWMAIFEQAGPEGIKRALEAGQTHYGL